MRANIVLTLLFASLCALSSSAHASPADFPKPAVLEPNVALWKHVYVDWSVNDIAFHDDEDYGIIYRVVRVPPRGGKDDKGRSRKDVVANAQKELNEALASLAKKKPENEDGLADVEKEVFTNLKNVKRPDKYTRAGHIRAQNGLKERFVQGWQNAGMYESFIRSELTRSGLPEELIGIAYVESLFFTGARSKVGAAGIWQFMSYTGREYMQLNHVVDERWDPMLATEAAAKYLRQAYKELGAWPLAITSYNYGRAGMARLVEEANSHDFSVILAQATNRRFGVAARNYYACFLAVLEILQEAPTRFAGVSRKPTWEYDVVRAPFPVLSTQIVATGLVDASAFDWLNPGLTRDAVDGKVPLPHGYSFRVPRGTGDAVLTKLGSLSNAEKTRALAVVTGTHKATGKQSITDIAKRYGIATDLLASVAGVAADAVPAKGQKIPLPAANARYTLLPEARGTAAPALPPLEPLVVASVTQLPTPSRDTGRVGLSPRSSSSADTTRTLTSVASQGLVTIARMQVTDVIELPAADVVAGSDDVLMPDVDAVAGAWPEVSGPPQS